MIHAPSTVENIINAANPKIIVTPISYIIMEITEMMTIRPEATSKVTKASVHFLRDSMSRSYRLV